MNGYRYFAFLDLLGYRELIDDDLRNGRTDLKDRLASAFEGLSNVNEADVGLRAISDSIFVSLNNNALGFKYFAGVLQELQQSFLSSGLLLRGGVTFALHFENSKVTYSPALAEAYNLESNRAFFPRILIHENVIEKLKNEELLDDVLESSVVVAHAGTYQIHLLNNGVWADCYAKLKELAERQDVVVRADPRIYAKHWYMQEYLAHFKPKGQRFRRYLPSWGV